MMVLFWVVCAGLPIVLGVMSVRRFKDCTTSEKPGPLVGLGIGAIFISLALIPVIVFTTWSGFGPGPEIGVLSFLTGLVLIFALRSPKGIQTTEARPRKAAAIVKGILVLSFLFPPIGAYAMWKTCDAFNRGAGNALLPALESFRLEHGGYPKSLDSLVPRYIDRLPTTACLVLSRWTLGIMDLALGGQDSGRSSRTDFYLCQSGGSVFLAVEGTTLMDLQALRLPDGEWISWDFIESDCPPIR